MNIIDRILGEIRSKVLPKAYYLTNPNLNFLVEKVNLIGKSLKNTSDQKLKALSFEIEKKVKDGTTLDEVAPNYFAIVREACTRIVRLTPYDEQVFASFILAQGAIAEIGTGEGKTLIAILPVALHALKHNGVHLATVNRYLASRDFEFTSPVYNFLGLTTSLITEDDPPDVKVNAYKQDIIYGTGYQFGFDYLHEQLRLIDLGKEKLGENYKNALLKHSSKNQGESIHKVADFAVIDEVDSVLLDEGFMPLIIAGRNDAPNTTPQLYIQAKTIAHNFIPSDYYFENADQKITLTPQGKDKVYHGNIKPNITGLKRPFHIYVENALKAEKFFIKDKHYMIEDKKIIIVDENTGRKFAERTWRDGLHQAVQCKEAVSITQESESLATISRQRYFNLYPKFCGMTGTALENKQEFYECFNLRFFQVPLHKPSKQEIYPSRIFHSQEYALNAIIEDVKKFHAIGRPILIGTRTIVDSEKIAKRLKKLQIKFKLLNAKQDENEAEIVAAAGQKGAITIATNMAGRGTHINNDKEVQMLGGLHVIGLEHNLSRRIDRQLAGRSARQGQPGSVQFFLSADDYILQRYAHQLVTKLKMQPYNSLGEIDKKWSSHFTEIQLKIEHESYYIRKQLIAHDKWIDSIKQKL